MKRVLTVSVTLAAFAGWLLAQEAKLAKPAVQSASGVHYIPAKGVKSSLDAEKLVDKLTNLTYHGGPTLTSAKVVFIFWGPSFAPGGADNGYATTLQSFRDQFGTTGQYNVLTQYSGIQLTSLGSGTPDLFDTTTPPINVTDSVVRSEVSK
jgi:hypothetical protein